MVNKHNKTGGGAGTNQYQVRGRAKVKVSPSPMVASSDLFKMALNQTRTNPTPRPNKPLGKWDTVDFGDGTPPYHVLDIDDANEVSAQAMWLETGDEADGSECTPQGFPGRPSYWVSVVKERSHRVLDDEAYVDSLDDAKKWVQEKVASGEIAKALAKPPV